jgi:uncharacterized protein
MCDISPCGGGRCFLTITASGEMIPCGEFIGIRGFSGGNIFKNSLTHAMRSLPFRQVRARIVEDIPECNICVFRNFCGAPCPAELYALDKTSRLPYKHQHGEASDREKTYGFKGMYRKAVFCEFYKEIINYAFKLISDKKEKYLFRNNSLENLEYQYFL